MSNSPLVSHTRISPNRTVGRNHLVDTITPHCVVGQCSVETLGYIFADSDKEASSNYGIGYDGKVGMYCEEKDRSWCTSSSSNDNRAITIECASDAYHPYAFKTVVYNKLIELCVDICKRYNKTKLLWLGDKTKTLNYKPASNEMLLTVHRWFENKSCPGDWMYARMGDLAEKVTAQLSNGTASNEKPVVNKLYRVRKSWADAKSQIGAYTNLNNAKAVCDKKGSGYFVFDENGKVVYPVVTVNTADNKIDTVKEVQKWLNNSHAMGVVVDGIYGSQTQAALVKVLQKALGVFVDGVYGQQTNAAVKTLKIGSSGLAVEALQGLLVCNGYTKAYIDGDYGSYTYNAVTAYQSKKNLVVDGEAGKETFSSLCK